MSIPRPRPNLSPTTGPPHFPMAPQPPVVHPARIRVLRPGDPARRAGGPVVYWAFRDPRVRDNWALLHAASAAAAAGVPFAVTFALFPPPFFANAAFRHLSFLLRHLRRLSSDLASLNIPFFLLHSLRPEDAVPALLMRTNASVLVTDFSPLREIRNTLEIVADKAAAAGIEVRQVDAHNVVPVWVASDKLEYGARTIRGRINKLLPEFLVEFSEIGGLERVKWSGEQPEALNWDALIEGVRREAIDVPDIDWCEPGEEAAMDALVGTSGFLTKRIKNYAGDRNDPSKPLGLSRLSPYLHFGQISPQRCALEAKKRKNLSPQSVDAFLEELIVRRELAENFCYYQPHYDSLAGCWEWARKTLMDHANDKREHIYTKEQLENAKTADPLWNAAQLEMVHLGKMHGFMRMYWAKKILEWTTGPEEALSIAIYLNDKYHIDGRDPNGYVGCMWSICGVHDQGWKERPIFGKIRYMNYAGCKRKFDVDAYISHVKRSVGQSKKRKAGASLNSFVLDNAKVKGTAGGPQEKYNVNNGADS